jgi:ABC-type lipopolysaccharide export system ATPase subunit
MNHVAPCQTIDGEGTKRQCGVPDRGTAGFDPRRSIRLVLDEPFEGVAPALSARLSEVIGGLRGGDLSVLIAQSDLNHSKNLLDAEIVIERGANRQPT